MLRLTTRLSVAARACVAALVVATLGATIATPAMADGVDEPPAIRWSVTPADATGPDGRTAVEQTLDPGETADDNFAVRNASDAEVTFQLTAADGFYTRTGRFDILAADQESVAAGTWISVPETVTVPAGGTVVVPFTTTVPELAEPGDHAAGITASVLSVQSSEDGTSVGVESRVGFRVTTRVTGELAPKAAIEQLTGDYALSWNPFRPGEVTVMFDVANEGNAIVLAEGSVSAGGQSVGFPAEGENPQELLPGDTRTLTATVEDVWPLFLVATGVTLTPTVRTMDGASTAMTPVTAEVLVWAVPWPQLILIGGLVLVILAIAWGRIRSRRKVAALVEDAREQGRREAAAREDASPAPLRQDAGDR